MVCTPTSRSSAVRAATSDAGLARTFNLQPVQAAGAPGGPRRTKSYLPEIPACWLKLFFTKFLALVYSDFQRKLHTRVSQKLPWPSPSSPEEGLTLFVFQQATVPCRARASTHSDYLSARRANTRRASDIGRYAWPAIGKRTPSSSSPRIGD